MITDTKMQTKEIHHLGPILDLSGKLLEFEKREADFQTNVC